jgi:hypothetical protein
MAHATPGGAVSSLGHSLLQGCVFPCLNERAGATGSDGFLSMSRGACYSSVPIIGLGLNTGVYADNAFLFRAHVR